MHARELVELASILSAQGPVLIHGAKELSPYGVQQYWTAAKCRLDRWARGLRSCANEASSDPAVRRVRWPTVCGLVEEILTTEVLTRVWTAIVCLADRMHGTHDAEPVARSIMIGHLEARHRVLMLLVRGPGIDAEGAVKLNHLRRRAERWSDLLVGHLAPCGDIGEFAFDVDRAREFARDLHQQTQATGRQAWQLLSASLRSAFRQGLLPASPNADLNAAVASAILACVPAELFDSTGLFRSLWLTRLTNVTNDVQGMIDSLVGPVEPRAGTSTSARRIRRFGQ